MHLTPRARRCILYGAAVAVVAASAWREWPEPPSPPPAAPGASAATDAAEPSPLQTAAADQADDVQPPAPAVESSPTPAPAAGATPAAEPKDVEPVPKVRIYTVAEGDTASAIAERFGLQLSTILWSNGIDEDTILQIGQELRIPPTDGIIHEVAEGDTLWDIALAYGADVDEVIRANPDVSPDSMQPGDLLVVPGGVPPRLSTMVASRGTEREWTEPVPEPEPESGGWSGSLLWPLSGEITEYFGWRTHPVYGTSNYHEGIDIAVPPGTPVRATAAGTVTLAEWYGGWGLTVKVDHGGGLVSRYSHNGELLVSVGEWVEAGQVIAYSGNTGVSTGPHLDFGIYQYGEPVNPLALLP